MISDVDADVPSTRIASGPAKVASRGLTTNFSVVSRMYKRPELLIRLRDEPTRHPHGHDSDATGISAQIDDEALALLARLNGVAERGHQPLGIQKHIECDVTDVPARQPATS